MKGIIIIIFLLQVCTWASSQTNSQPCLFDLSIEFSKIRKCDFCEGVYCIYSDGAFVSIPFNLSKRDKKKLYKNYYRLGLQKLEKDKFYDDSCIYQPKSYNTLRFNIKGKSQVIKIDPNCDRFDDKDRFSAKNVQKYIAILKEIMQSKKEIRDAPKSNIIIM